MTEFLKDHPGGINIILRNACQDCSSEFEDIGHSDKAKDLVKKYTIGKVGNKIEK